MKKLLPFLLFLSACSSATKSPTYTYTYDGGLLVLKGSVKYYCTEIPDSPNQNKMKCFPDSAIITIDKQECNGLIPGADFDESRGVYAYECWKK
jgi:hypothetical protein